MKLLLVIGIFHGVAAISILTLNLFIRQPLIVSHLLGDHKDERIQHFCNHIVRKFDVIALQEVFTDRRKQQIIDCAKEVKQGLSKALIQS